MGKSLAFPVAKARKTSSIFSPPPRSKSSRRPESGRSNRTHVPRKSQRRIEPIYDHKDPHLGFHRGRPVIDLLSPDGPEYNLEFNEKNIQYFREKVKEFENDDFQFVLVIHGMKPEWKRYIDKHYRTCPYRQKKNKKGKFEGITVVKFFDS